MQSEQIYEFQIPNNQVYGHNDMTGGENTLSFTQLNMLNSNLSNSYDRAPNGHFRDPGEVAQTNQPARDAYKANSWFNYNERRSYSDAQNNNLRQNDSNNEKSAAGITPSSFTHSTSIVHFQPDPDDMPNPPQNPTDSHSSPVSPPHFPSQAPNKSSPQKDLKVL